MDEVEGPVPEKVDRNKTPSGNDSSETNATKVELGVVSNELPNKWIKVGQMWLQFQNKSIGINFHLLEMIPQKYYKS